MRPTDMEPQPDELEDFLEDEERALLDDAGVPDEVKTEIRERLERFRERDLEAERGEDAEA